MPKPPISIRTFIGAKDFNTSRAFYSDIGFEESVISDSMSRFSIGDHSFYLQQYYVEDWVDNTMMLLEVEDLASWFQHLQSLALKQKYPGTMLIPIKQESWGRECMLTDPSGVLWHFAEYPKRS